MTESFTVAAGTLLVVRLAADLSSDNGQDRATASRASSTRTSRPTGASSRRAGAKVYGIVSAADSASKMKGTASLSVTLTDMQVGGQVLSIKTQPLNVKGGKGTGTKKLVGGAAVGAAIGAIAGGGEGAAIGRRGRRRGRRRGGGGRRRQGGGHPRADAAGLHAGGAVPGGDHDERGGAVTQTAGSGQLTADS